MSAETSQSTSATPSRPQTPDDDFWTGDLTRFDIYLDGDNRDRISFEEFENTFLWHKTCLRMMTAEKNESSFLDVQYSYLDEEQAIELCSRQQGKTKNFELFYISRDLQREQDKLKLPIQEHHRLRISPRAFRHLISTYQIPTGFLMSFVYYDSGFGTGFRRQSHHEWDYWCRLFSRDFHFCESCQAGTHLNTVSTNSDPLSVIHLDNQRCIISRSRIVLYIKRNSQTRKTQVIIVDFIGGHDSPHAQAPLSSIQKALESRSRMDLDDSPCFVLLVYIAFILRYWEGTIHYFNGELISLETRLRQEIANETADFIDASKVLNAALHNMAAHLHRYKVELEQTGLVLAHLQKYRHEMTYKPKPEPKTRGRKEGRKGKRKDRNELPPIDQELYKIEQLTSKVTALSNTLDELEMKVQNILALLFHQIQAVNDTTLQAILNASQQENRISQKLSLASHMLSKSMKRDSIAMKTIAIMTLAFLPGATFAAVFAMPFFTASKYLSAPSQVWIWAVLTLICTAFAFGGYMHRVSRGKKTLGDPEDDDSIEVPKDGSTATGVSSTAVNDQNTSSSSGRKQWWRRVPAKVSQGGIEPRRR